MSFQKPSIPKGTRDFTPLEMVRRNYIFDTIREVFELYGYQPIETPAMENLSTLLGKYGEEGDKLLFKILNSGDFLEKSNTAGALSSNYRELLPLITEKGLRYDLTVPFARFVVQNKNDLAFPFKRYQIQPVWRADRPQKGRYREFFQCDVDVIGSDALLNEIELILITDEIFSRLRIRVTVKINNRKILAGIAEVTGQPDKLTDITISIDKLDKTGIEPVKAELLARGITPQAIEKIESVLLLEGDYNTILNELERMLKTSETGLKGVSEVRFILEYSKTLSLRCECVLDVKLARGLNYYTGAIIEVKSNDVQIGSICGGGRYDDLTGIFGLPGVSGVGISFGADRIYDVMNELSLFPVGLQSTTKLLFINFGDEEERYCLPILSELRKNGIHSEIYPDHAKLKKQMEYANKKNIPFVVLVGKDEMEKGMLTVKNMITGEQKVLPMGEIITQLTNNN